MTHDAVRPVSPGGRRFSDVMPVAMLPAFIERQGGAVVAVPVAAGGPLTAQVAVQDGARFHAPALAAHFVEIALRGSARGSVHAEGGVSRGVMKLASEKSFGSKGREPVVLPDRPFG